MQVCVRFEPYHRQVWVPAGTTLLEAARLAGLPVANACRAGGICGRCGLEILRSMQPVCAEEERERVVKQRNRVDPLLRLSCRIIVESDLVVTAPYW